ncbi:hypothetical protein CALVIDRAFT_536518 [Calocera viscosa TUFC12733]|uniref:Uncharacterized protein n=1 Tax=Calocera viscosa (strain TUFC12733) TaxID=1330018 RepID=A0A167MTM7_CALVF|nr:hypothetical protein CALVIDRAFT_536518 [Calocera viscosa TUFC12733]
MEQCANSDLTCLCTTVSTLSTACRNCWLGLVGLTQAQYTADCAGGGSMSGGSGSSMGMGMSVGNGGSSATSTSSSSASSPTSPPKSDGRRAGVGGALGVVLAAMVVLA